MVVGVCSFAHTGDCISTPGGFARLTRSVLQWIQKVKVKQNYSKKNIFDSDRSSRKANLRSFVRLSELNLSRAHNLHLFASDSS